MTPMIVDQSTTNCQYDALHDCTIPTPDMPTPDNSLLSMGLQTSTSDQICSLPDSMDFILKDVKNTTSQPSTSSQDHLLNNCFNTPEDSLTSLHSKEVDTVTDISTSELLDSTSQSSVNAKDNLDNSLSSLNSTNEINAVLNLSTSSPSIPSNQSTVTNSYEKTATIKQATVLKALDQNETIEVLATNGDLNISKEILKVAKIPQFKPKKKKLDTSEVTVNSVGNVIETLQKKETQKILKQTQIEINKKKEDKKALKDKGKAIAKSFVEKKKYLNDQKKIFNSQIKALQISIKNEINKENQSILEDHLKPLLNNLEEIEREIVNVEVQSLQAKIKIKTEKF